MKVLHIITDLTDGGAQAVLYRLCKYDQENNHRVISLASKGKYGSMLAGLGVSVTTLNMAPSRPSPLAFIRLVKLLACEKPDVVQTWMYHSDLFGGLAARVAGIRSVVWGVRASSLSPSKSKKATILITKVLARVSWWLPAKIIVCAQIAIEAHECLGYDRSKMHLIRNGYDLRSFRPGLDPQDKLKESLLPYQSIPLIGTVGRFDPQKDHGNLLDALGLLRDRGLAFRCMLVGTGLDSSNEQIRVLIAQRGLGNHVRLLGRRDDIPNIMNALDLHVLPSGSEAFPNVVAEAMACGTPCVVTDVGDASFIVGDTGWIAPSGNAKALAEAIGEALEYLGDVSKGNELRMRARRRIEEKFSIKLMVDSYRYVWNKV